MRNPSHRLLRSTALNRKAPMVSIPKTCAEIDAAWLNEALGDEARGGEPIANVDVTIIGEGVGFMGEVARLTLGYDSLTPSGVTSLIAKVPTLEEGARFVGQLIGLYEKEHRFYSEVAPEIRIPIPEALVNLGDKATGDYVLVLEDLAPMRPGDQLAGCTPTEASQALATLAKLHSRWWNDPRLNDFAEWMPGHDSEFFQITKIALKDGVEAFLELWGDAVPQSVVDILTEDDEDDALYNKRLLATIGRAPFTVAHGDYRLDNMMFGDGETTPQVAIIDWQLPLRANPMSDVMYFIAGNIAVETRREVEADLVRGYHEELIAGGVEDYPFETCWTDYRVGSVLLMSFAVVAAANIDLDVQNDRGRELFEVMFDRYMSAIVDHDPFPLID